MWPEAHVQGRTWGRGWGEERGGRGAWIREDKREGRRVRVMPEWMWCDRLASSCFRWTLAANDRLWVVSSWCCGLCLTAWTTPLHRGNRRSCSHVVSHTKHLRSLLPYMVDANCQVNENKRDCCHIFFGVQSFSSNLSYGTPTLAVYLAICFFFSWSPLTWSGSSVNKPLHN